MLYCGCGCAGEVQQKVPYCIVGMVVQVKYNRKCHVVLWVWLCR